MRRRGGLGRWISFGEEKGGGGDFLRIQIQFDDVIFEKGERAAKILSYFVSFLKEEGLEDFAWFNYGDNGSFFVFFSDNKGDADVYWHVLEDIDKIAFRSEHGEKMVFDLIKNLSTKEKGGK